MSRQLGNLARLAMKLVLWEPRLFWGAVANGEMTRQATIEYAYPLTPVVTYGSRMLGGAPNGPCGGPGLSEWIMLGLGR